MCRFKSKGYTLALLLNLLNVVGSIWTQHCPQKCTCNIQYSNRLLKDLRTIDCAKAKLRKFPQDVPSNAEALLLQGNAINVISEHLPKLTNLMELDLSDNDISNLGYMPLFENMTKLQYLSLSRNSLKMLYHGSFSGLVNLVELDLSDNNLENMETHAFGGLNSLKTINLGQNNLKTLLEEWLFGMSNLEVLRLEDNKISVISKNVFQQLLNLRRLQVARNRLFRIEKGAFKNLENLTYLSLENNRFEQVPPGVFVDFRNIFAIILDGNPIRMISTGAFEFMNARSIHLSKMPKLRMVDRYAFTNMPYLQSLSMTHNPQFVYIDPGAFYHVPLLRHLYLENNKLMTLPYEMVHELPSLTEISYFNNPINCDCNVRWIRKAIIARSVAGENSTHLKFINSNKYQCSIPSGIKGKFLKNLSLSLIEKECPPMIMPLFNSTYQKQIGDSIEFICRAIGLPRPHIAWGLSNGRTVNGTSNHSGIQLVNGGTLVMRRIKAPYGGRYTCWATNDAGTVSRITHLKVHSNNIRIIPSGVSSNFITVTWNGTGQTIQTSEYMLLYKKWGTDSEYKQIHLRQYMRTYTIMNLKSVTDYEFCIAYEHEGELHTINCRVIQTLDDKFANTGIRHFSSIAIIIGLITTIAVVLIVCMAVAAIRRWHKRKSYADPDGPTDNKVENMSQIPLDNIYPPPSTPICGSTTSLITNMHASA
ncbi:leucine-rich repeat neuronal protein 1-like [Tubulanus polymorphus]|uniref:leucine-rich repeat neuronal protein 1-like n=1 Tax=Tubulanus polymorphus TaxID=672921 RepID=UPI003DA41179